MPRAIKKDRNAAIIIAEIILPQCCLKKRANPPFLDAGFATLDFVTVFAAVSTELSDDATLFARPPFFDAFTIPINFCSCVDASASLITVY